MYIYTCIYVYIWSSKVICPRMRTIFLEIVRKWASVDVRPKTIQTANGNLSRTIKHFNNNEAVTRQNRAVPTMHMYIYIRMYVYTYIHMHTYKHTHTNIHTYILIDTDEYMCIRACMHACHVIHMNIDISMYVHACVLVPIIYINMHLHSFIYRGIVVDPKTSLSSTYVSCDNPYESHTMFSCGNAYESYTIFACVNSNESQTTGDMSTRNWCRNLRMD